MKAIFQISNDTLGQFKKSCEVAIVSIGSSTKSACTEAAQEIMMDSMNQVPRATGTLASSAFVGVSRRVDTKTYRYGAVLGYGAYEGVGSVGGLGSVVDIEWFWAPSNPRNPKSHMLAGAYASKVHEDLNMQHPNGGKAKFLEDPVRAWASGRFSRLMAEYWKVAIERTSSITLSSLSNSSIAKAINAGKIDAEFPQKPDILVNPDRSSMSPTQFAKAYNKARADYGRGIAAYNTAQSALKNPAGKKRRDRNNLRYIKQNTTTYSPTKTGSTTYKGNK